jgi:hypothetical protein
MTPLKMARFFKSAKDAARTTEPARNCFAPHCVLREFHMSPPARAASAA